MGSSVSSLLCIFADDDSVGLGLRVFEAGKRDFSVCACVCRTDGDRDGERKQGREKEIETQACVICLVSYFLLHLRLTEPIPTQSKPKAGLLFQYNDGRRIVKGKNCRIRKKMVEREAGIGRGRKTNKQKKKN